MAGMVPDVGRVAIANKYLNQNLSLRLYSNNVTPAEGDTAGTYTEVAGGGYAAKTLAFASWTVGATGIASYAAQDFTFTGVTNAPGTIYGYYILDALGVLLCAERFPDGVLPFTPIAASIVRVTPRIVTD